ncbi:SIS domain-containing protein [Streptococcus orisasini]|uniref:SIS domain-containing protein n=1 Tax=Streptococcus orisasini TaxID=1080071 RepID=UPI00071045E2|nr:SIS domain-containing protein [Streptococcus orisasini]
MNSKDIISEIVGSNDITSVMFVGCGASKGELYPAKYFLDHNAKNLQVSHFTANEFNFATPANLGSSTIVISASLGGTTPETVKSNSIAKEHGAHVITLTRAEGSPLTVDADYTIVHRFAESYSAKLEKMGYALELAVEILNQVEGYEYYPDMIDGLNRIYDFCDEAVKTVEKDAKYFAEQYKDAPGIYVMSSGATAEVAYSSSVCLMMEMQWINSGNFHSGEFFHGPFEIVEKDVPFILFMNEGSTRPLDARALTFLQRFDAKVTTLDALDFGLSSAVKKTVVDYFNPFVITAVFRVYAEQLAIARQHPLTKRRYMWKLEY